MERLFIVFLFYSVRFHCHPLWFWWLGWWRHNPRQLVYTLICNPHCIVFFLAGELYRFIYTYQFGVLGEYRGASLSRSDVVSVWKDTIQFQDLPGSYRSHHDLSLRWLYNDIQHLRIKRQAAFCNYKCGTANGFLQALSILMHCIGVSRLDSWLFLVSFGCLEFGIRIQKGT